MRIPSPSDRTVSSAANAVPETNLRRRNFLFSLGAGGAGAASVALNALPAVAAVTPQATESKPHDSGYRETEHVRDYYRSTKL